MSAAMQARLAAELLAAGMGMPSEAADDMIENAQRMGINFDSFGTLRSSKQIIEEHKQALHSLAQKISRSGATMQISNSWNTKPAEDFPSPPPYAALMPIGCEDLKPQTTHRCATDAVGSFEDIAGTS